MENILCYIKKEVSQACNVDNALLANFVCEYPKNKNHGDFATNIAMVLAKHYKVSPMELAPIFSQKIATLDFVKSTSVASPGFINIFVKPELLNKMMFSIHESTALPNYGNGEKINIEYISANPTGPLHVGHLRGAIYGDVLSSMLSQTGFNVTKEYYINDAGNQINILAKSVYIRYLQLLGKDVSVPEGCYPAEYIVEIAEEIVKKYGRTLEEKDSVFRDYAVHYNMEWIKKTMKKLKIQHDVFSSEREIVNSNAINEAFDEYNKVMRSNDYRRINTWLFVNEWDPSDQVHIENLSDLVEEFRERVPILVRVQDSQETCHLICMLDHLRTTN